MSARKAAAPAKAQPLLIGAHISISGGVELAPLRGRDVGCACIQIFTKSNMQWAARPLGEKEIAAFKLNCAETGIAPVVAHNSYLINLGAPDAALAKKSADSFLMELERCRALGLPAIIAHPGSHTGAGEAEGLRRIRSAVDELLDRTAGSHVHLLLETTAGQGSNLGYRFEQLAEMMEGVKQTSRVGVCLDTCHVFAAGYDIRTEDGYRRTMEEFDKTIGLKKLQAFHINDSKGELGSKLDRHEHIGHGRLGQEPFRLLLRDQRFAAIPKVLETPKGMKGKLEWDVINLRLLRQLGGEKE
jgi:deoxyribonuclease-4